MSHQREAKQVLDVVPKTMRFIRSYMRASAQGQLTVPQFRVLIRLARGESTHKELAEWIGITPATLTRMVDTLVKKGYVVRALHRSDRRQVRLVLTPKGRVTYEEFRRKAQSTIHRHITKLNHAERKCLNDGLALLARLFT